MATIGSDPAMNSSAEVSASTESTDVHTGAICSPSMGQRVAS
jgi:hypothetical protein